MIKCVEQICFQDTVMRQLAAEGLSKLLLSGRIASAHVLTRLILLWFNPITSMYLFIVMLCE